MTNYTIIEVNDNNWSKIISQCYTFDFYHTQSYHQLENNSRPVLFVLYFDVDFIAIPLIIRTIPNSKNFDITSAYGYCGPVSNLPFEKLPEQLINNFNNQLSHFFQNNNIISAFSRLHPLINNENILNSIGNIKLISYTVAIDLLKTEEEQKLEYRKSTKYEINQLRKKGFIVQEALNNEEIEAFIQIYTETMQRVNASGKYYFDKKYFYTFLNNNCFKSKLLIAKFNSEIVAGAIFTITQNIMQYHLAGTKSSFINEKPMKLIIDEARILGNKLKLHFLHLGGGVGGNSSDTLFLFKSGFSKQNFTFKVWQNIIDQNQYDKLVMLNNKAENQNSSFFPLYRI